MADSRTGLELLLHAPDKETVLALMDDSFLCRETGWTVDHCRQVANQLNIPEGQPPPSIAALHASAALLIKEALYSNPKSTEEIDELFPSEFHPKLKGLLIKVLAARLGPWREQIVSSPFVTTPRLKDFDWVVNPTSTGILGVGAKDVTATIRLTVQQSRLNAAVIPDDVHVALEVDRETLGEMVDTFAGIRDQLAAMTTK
eukprot:CAMPEP_0198707080 /NCGR_PEP_ID=MMETSP1468-20131203/391289_1 /TAXON_ID=1461545 /ORGANISM="Mantoniella sp, Strain CCMP1436" /LENGTH=200 /DNA_ID=CAMNT_0044466039 /DNA_START=1451 /DNA_END=2053 /DNA_ORIENTATION=+